MNDEHTQLPENADQPGPREDNHGLFLKLQTWIRADIQHTQLWRHNCVKEFHFAAGPGQWEESDRQALRDEHRPVVEFNQTLKYVRAVCGIEANNRHSIIYLPVNVTEEGDVLQNEVLTGASEWMERGSDANKKQSRAFRDATICGMGWTETHLDFDTDPLGVYKETRVPPWQMGWDCNARDDNLADSRRRWRARKMPLQEARDLLPGVTDDPSLTAEDLDATWAGELDTPTDPNPKTQEAKELREASMAKDDARREVTIFQIQWWEYETYYQAVNPQLLINPNAPRFIELPQAPANGQSRRLRRKVFKQAFVGGKVLEVGPAPREDGFTMHCITYEPDDVAGTWYGIVRVLRDPQVWSNKFFSQLMHIVNSTAKGGILVESDAMENSRDFLRDYAKPNAVTVLRPNAIGKGKVMAKPGAGITGGVLQLLTIADGSFAKTLGLNLEMMGLADRNQPGILEAQRKQAAMTILATLFDNYAAFKKDVGQCRLYYIQNHLARDQARMIRVAGENGYKAIPLMAQNVNGEFDTIVSDAPSSPNTKEKVWAALMQVLPAFSDMLTPEVALTILDYAPGLPSDLVQSLRKIAQKPNPEADRQKALAITSAVEDIAAKRAQTEQTKAQTEAARAGAILDIAKLGMAKRAQDFAGYEAILAQLSDDQDRAAERSANALDGGALTPANTPPIPQGLPELGDMMPPAAAAPPSMPGGLAAPGGL